MDLSINKYNSSSSLWKLPMFDVGSFDTGECDSIYSLAFGNSASSAFMSNPFDSQISPYSNDFWQYMNNDFASTMMLFDSYMQASMPSAWDNTLFDKSYNTTAPDIKVKTQVKPKNYVFKTDYDQRDLVSLKDVYNPKLSGNLANIAEKNATSMNSKGRCSKGVRLALEDAGLSRGEFRAPSAYQAAEKLREHKNFKEVEVDRDDLKKLPAGCIVVWNPYNDRKGKYHEHGHIAVTLGDGREASDRVANLREINSKFSVFVPTGVHGSA